MLRTLAHFLAAHALAMLMLSVGLRTERGVLLDLRERWKILVRALAIVWVAVPTFCLLLLLAIQPTQLAAGTLMVMAICPGAPLVLQRSRRSRGDPTTSLLILTATALTAIVFVPIWELILEWTTPLELTLGLSDIASVVLPAIIVPYAIGRIINDVSPRIAAPMAKITQALFLAGLAVLAIVVIARGVPALADLTIRDIVAAALVSFAAAALGYWGTHGAVEQRVSVTYAAALGNPALALAVIAQSYHLAVLPLVGAFALLRALALVPFGLAFKLQLPRRNPKTAHM